MRARDRRDDFLLRRNAKKAQTADYLDDETNTDTDDKTLNSQSNSKVLSQRSTVKRRRETLQQSEVVVKIESNKKALSKEDWKEIMAVGASSSNTTALHNEVGSLRSTVKQLSSQAEQTNNLLQQLLMMQQREVFNPSAARPRYPFLKETETEEGLHAEQAQADAEQAVLDIYDAAKALIDHWNSDVM
jgi:hypothetical protein